MLVIDVIVIACRKNPVHSIFRATMSGLKPSIPDDLGVGSRFRHSTNRRQELSVQMELDAVAMKSIAEISMKKEEREAIPKTESEMTSRYLHLEEIHNAKH